MADLRDVLPGWGAASGERLLCCALYMYDFDRPPGRVPARAVRVRAALGAEIDIDLYPLRSRSE